jgi:hypothetical protein
VSISAGSAYTAYPLTTFPRARAVSLRYISDGEYEYEGKEALLQWLHEGGRGRHLATVRMLGEVAHDLIHTVVREGALPSLRSVDVNLRVVAARASLREGFLGAMHELRVTVDVSEDHQVASLRWWDSCLPWPCSS